MEDHRLRSAVSPTAIGALGIVWGEAGIRRIWIHAGTVERARASIRRWFPGALETAPPPAVSWVIAEIDDLLRGERRDLRTARLDMATIPEFDRRVYDVARTIAPGDTTTYGAIARELGEEPRRAKDVGQALARNPFAPVVPCHRVVAAGRRLGGYSAPGGQATKRRLLELEGAAVVIAPEQTALFDQV